MARRWTALWVAALVVAASLVVTPAGTLSASHVRARLGSHLTQTRTAGRRR
jgi:hypothetical protein